MSESSQNESEACTIYKRLENASETECLIQNCFQETFSEIRSIEKHFKAQV
jgi:hypothetical protein